MHQIKAYILAKYVMLLMNISIAQLICINLFSKLPKLSIS